MQMTNQRGSLPIERWAQHVVQAITVAAILWFAVSINQLSISDSITQVKLDTLQARLSDFGDMMQDRYTRTDAITDLQRVTLRLSDFEQRIRKLESYANTRVSP